MVRFFRACRVHRGQQRKDYALFGSRDDDLEAVALHPTVMHGTTPRTIAVDALQTLGNAAFLPKALVDRHAPRVGNPFAHSLFALQADRMREQLVGSTIAIEVSAPRWQCTDAQDRFQLPLVFREKAKLCRFALFLGSSEESVGSKQFQSNERTSAPARQRGSAPRASALTSTLNGGAKG